MFGLGTPKLGHHCTKFFKIEIFERFEYIFIYLQVLMKTEQNSEEKLTQN